MAKMSKKLQQKQEYLLNVKDLMDAVPTSTVAKIIDGFDEEDGTKYRLIKWVVDGYAVYSDDRDVYSIEPDETESFAFLLKARDYKKFVAACEARRAETYKKLVVKKKQ